VALPGSCCSCRDVLKRDLLINTKQGAGRQPGRQPGRQAGRRVGGPLTSNGEPLHTERMAFLNLLCLLLTCTEGRGERCAPWEA